MLPVLSFTSLLLTTSASFGNVGRDMFVHVPRILKEFDELRPDVDQYCIVKEAVCVLLLSASRFHHSPWKRECVRRINCLLENERDCYLQGRAAYVESKVLRVQGKPADSYKTLEEYIHKTVLPGLDEKLSRDARWNATKGDIIISFAENLMRDGDFSRAQAELKEWNPVNPEAPSTMEKVISRSRDVMQGRVLRNQARFHAALPFYEKLLSELSPEDYQVSTGWQMGLFSNIADLYCEVGRPDDAERVLERGLEIIHARGWQSISPGIRLQLALLESFIRRGMFKEAEEGLSKLIPIFEAIVEPDIIQNTGHFRAWVGLARVSHLRGEWDEALVRWYRGLNILKDSGWTQGFNHGITLYSIAQVLYRIGDLEKCHAAIESAEKSLAVEKRKYWIVGLGSYWYDYVVTDLGKAGPNPVVTQNVMERRNCLVDRIFGPWEITTKS